jgi:hypothetical protein
MKINTKSIYKGADVDGKTKIVCVSLFRMKNSYRGFSKYLDFCVQFIEKIQRILPDWFLRIYIDESIKNEELEVLKANNVELVEYKCEDFWNESSGTHEGTFGTFMRFLPMFSVQKYECMVSSDIDVDDFMVEYFKFFDQNAKEVGLVNQLCYNDWIPEDLKYSILAGGMFTKVVFPRLLLTNFLKEVKDGKVAVHITKQTDADTYVPYGTDEYFLTTKLYNYLEKNKIKIMALTISSVVGAIRKVLKNVKDERLKEVEKNMKKLTYLDHAFWKDPRKLSPESFKKYLEPIVKLIKPELEASRHGACILDYLDHPKMVRLKKYNY